MSLTPLTSGPDAALLFPTLTSAQVARIAAHGVTRPVARGEVLIEGAQTDAPFFVLRAGAIEVIRPSGLGDLLIAVLGPAQFTGDASAVGEGSISVSFVHRVLAESVEDAGGLSQTPAHAG